MKKTLGIVIARDGVGGRALNDELVVIINDDKFICVLAARTPSEFGSCE